MGLTPKICETLFKRIEQSNSESSALCFKTLIRLIFFKLFVTLVRPIMTNKNMNFLRFF